MAMFIIGITRLAIKKKNAGLYLEGIKQIDFKTIGLLIGIFIVIGSLTHAGVINDIGNLFSRASDNLFVIYTIIVWASVLFSAFIDNIPYVATMLPVVQTIAGNLGADPTVLYFGLLIGATLGGNITPVGASANIAGLGILKKEGYDVSTGTFMKISVPFTLAAVISGYILIWVIYR
jgi:Na+/H+ antiporter NhaD/arsenite permease-like protein